MGDEHTELQYVQVGTEWYKMKSSNVSNHMLTRRENFALLLVITLFHVVPLCLF